MRRLRGRGVAGAHGLTSAIVALRGWEAAERAVAQARGANAYGEYSATVPGD
ncbi:hypothetical protein ACFPH6_17940 [Streptomyces xiangluensis]|uniref:Uncharacterized protein n=1 Tax=Streptomyces xiangluensis TaxID=2665720 RepID=A0ABV8YQ29_9ACTN